mmetsp:Transcript_19859/g.29840  ORF Transcript_19859/g.29840 Transcript_19859/m.29840 type:complete len:243 (+) Transcript_19859:124-852(+)
MISSLISSTLRVCRPTVRVLANRSNRSSKVLSSVWRQRLATATPTTNRCFSSSNLSDILARELQEERENDSMPDELVELTEVISKDWTIVDDEESGTVKLFRKEGPEKVAVVFHCQDTLDEVGIEDGEEEHSPEVRFTLTMTKAGKTIVLNCVSVDASAAVEGVGISNEDIELIHDTGKIDEKLYQGPQYDELPEDLQEAFYDYVREECGITSDVAAFISMFADFKEQREYIRWLKQVQLIL